MRERNFRELPPLLALSKKATKLRLLFKTPTTDLKNRTGSRNSMFVMSLVMSRF